MIRDHLKSDYQFELYPEVSIRREADSFYVEAPWLEIEIELDEEHRNQDLDLKALHALPFLHVRPRKSLKKANFSEAKEVSILELAASGFQSLDILGQPLSWELDSILEKSRISKNAYDPVSVLSELRRLGLNQMLKSDLYDSLFSKAKALADHNKEAFSDFVRRILSQTHYVTLKALDSLRPAAHRFTEASDLIEQFMREEFGHHHLVERSLRAMGGSPEEKNVLSATKDLMRLLRYAAENHPLAFCALIALFEGNPYTEEDPLTSLIKIHPDFAAAAEGVEAHHRINRDGDHANVGLIMAERLIAQSKTEIKNAVKILGWGYAITNHMYRQLMDERHAKAA